jgi:omega-6 fatty acid desaturase (delta-12 desaturase)
MGKGGRENLVKPKMALVGAPLITAEKETLVAAVMNKDTLPTKKEIRDSIPPHCFEHSYVQAFGHVIRDSLVVATFALMAASLLKTHNLSAVDYLGWHLYAFFQGAALTGWWVLAHECGHGGFSASQLVNDCVGLVLHSVLLVPYFAWQYSHAKHHSKTNHLQDGETHNPNTKDEMHEAGYVTLCEAIGEEGFAGFQLFTHLVVGWPAYLATNATGARRLYNGKPFRDGETIDHFRPSSGLFPPSWRQRIRIGTSAWLVCFSAIMAATYKYGFVPVACFYWGPYMWVNFWLVLYTWLQHTSPDVPHFGDGEWTWVRGALCTIDRPYAELFGFFDWMHHHIGSTHVCHHLFSNLPAYNAVEATKHLKAYLKSRELYNYVHEPIIESMWKAAKSCQYVDAAEGIQFPKPVAGIKKD